MFEPGDEVVYIPNIPDLPPVSERPWDVGRVISIEGIYVNVKFPNEYTAEILPFGLQHHPLSPKAIRQQMRAVLEDMAGAVKGRLLALIFSEITGITAQRGFGPADILRSFLDPRPKRKYRYIT
jgi:hypothetical protein